MLTKLRAPFDSDPVDVQAPGGRNRKIEVQSNAGVLGTVGRPPFECADRVEVRVFRKGRN